MKYNNIRKIVNGILFETSYNIRSTEDHRAGQFAAHQTGEEDSGKPSLPKELPLQPSDNMGLNSIVSRPPIEDDSYVPKTPSELGAAIKALSELMGNDEVSSIYPQIKDIMKNGTGSEKVNEAYNDYGDFDLPDDSDMPEEFRSGYSIEEPEDEPEPSPSFKPSKTSGEASLDDILSLGILPDEKKSISSAKQFVGKSQANLALRLAFGLPEVEKAMEYALNIWVGALKADGGITEEQAAGFLQNPKGAIKSPGLKAFFQLGFAGPALKPILNARNRQIKKEIVDLGTPDWLKNMLFSQTVGLSPVNGKKIRMKLVDNYKDAEMNEVDDMVRKYAGYVKSNYEKYQKDYFKSVDLTKEVRNAWSKLSTDQKIDITYAAMDEVIDHDEKSRKAGLR